MEQRYEEIKQAYDASALKLLVWLAYGVPVIFFILSIPMILGLVPPNAVYGYRTQYTISSTDIWYAENYKAGIALAAVSFLAIIITYLIMKFSAQSIIHKTLYSIGALVFLIMAMISNFGS
jgi:hypothetical protein